MQFKSHAAIYTTDHKMVGHVKSVVMNPHNQEVNGLIVECGFIFKEDHVLPLSWVDRVQSNGAVIVTMDQDQFNQLPLFEETVYVSLENSILSATGYHDAYYFLGSPGGELIGGPYMPFKDLEPIFTQTEWGVSADMLTLQIDAVVVSSDGQVLGKLEEIVTLGNNTTATHFVIGRGVFSRDRKLVPIHWVCGVDNQEIFLTIKDDVIQRLPDYDSVDWKQVIQ